jgi:hypothetical protein
MKNLFLLAFCLFLFKISTAQVTFSPQYTLLVQKADSLYDLKAYKQSAFNYSEAFKANGWKAKTDDRYNAACSWSQAGYADSAFSNLMLIAGNGSYINYAHIIKDGDLVSLHNDSRWPVLIKLVKANQDKVEAHYNKPVYAELKQIYEDDQSGRVKMDSVIKKYGYDSKEMESLSAEIGSKDSIDLIKTENILDKYGWLGPDQVGDMGTITEFLVIQHADQPIHEKYLPMVRQAVKEGKARPDDLALLEDRTALEEGKKQIYGSQVGLDTKTNKYYLRPIEDEPNVNKRRASVGLMPLEKYAKLFGIEYTLPKE